MPHRRYTTISSGLRKRFLRVMGRALYSIVVYGLLLTLAVAAASASGALGVPALEAGLAPALSHDIRALAATCGIAAFGLIAVAVFVLVVVPWHKARGYVRQSLHGDYLVGKPLTEVLAEDPTSSPFAIWVATLDGNVVGTVGVEPAKTTPAADTVSGSNHPVSRRTEGGPVVRSRIVQGFAWEEGDAELRRMSVDPAARGMQVSKLLFEALKLHCVRCGRDTVGFCFLRTDSRRCLSISWRPYTCWTCNSPSRTPHRGVFQAL